MMLRDSAQNAWNGLVIDGTLQRPAFCQVDFGLTACALSYTTHEHFAAASRLMTYDGGESFALSRA